MTERTIDLTEVWQHRAPSFDKMAMKALLDVWLLPLMTNEDTIEEQVSIRTKQFKPGDIFHYEALAVTEPLYLHGGRTRIYDPNGNKRIVTESTGFIEKKLIP